MQFFAGSGQKYGDKFKFWLSVESIRTSNWEDDGMFIEDTLPLERRFELNEEEEASQETNLEISWKMEAEMLESRARGALYNAWEEATNLLEGANMEVARYRMVAANLIRKAESKGNLIRIAPSSLEETSKR